MSDGCRTMPGVSALGVRPGSVRVRLDVSHAQAGGLVSAAGARRFAFNWAVGRVVANHAQWQAEESYGIPKGQRTRPFSFFDLNREWNRVKDLVAPWHAEHSTWTFVYGIRAAQTAHTRFLKGQGRFPRFKARHRDRPRFTVKGAGVHLEPGRVRVAKYGWLRIAAPCPAQARLRRLLSRGRARIVNATVTQASDGYWYATICFERQIRVPRERWAAPDGPTVGVDVGVKTAAVVTTADRTVVAELVGSRALRDALKQVKHLQRNLSRTEKGSRNRAKARARLARAHSRVVAVRTNRLHTFTSQLARSHGVIVVEDLAVANMLKNHHLAAAISDQGWGELRRQLQYKTTRHGGQLIAADRFFPSSKTCSRCGAVKAKQTLAERTYTCGVCTLVADRDVNAAANLAAWGEHQLTLVIQDGDRHPGGPTAQNLAHACGGGNEPAHPVPVGAPVEAGTSQPLVA